MRPSCTSYFASGGWSVNRSSRLNWTRSPIGSTIFGQEGEKDVQGIVRAINNRCNDWFKVLQRRWPQHKDRHGSVEALLRSRPMMFRFIIVRQPNILAAIPKEDMKLYEDKS